MQIFALLRKRRLLPRRTSIKTTLIFILGITAPQLYGDVPAGSLSASQAIEIALRDNPNVAAMQVRYDALVFRPSQLGSLPDPIISWNAINYPTDTFSRSQEPMTQIQIGFSQQIPFPGKLDLKQQAAEYESVTSFHRLEEGKLQLAKDIKTKWWQIHYLDRALASVDQSKTVLRQFISAAQTNYETGKGLQKDLLLSQLELSTLLNNEIQLNALHRNHSIQLNLLMGQPASTKIVVSNSVSKQLPNIFSEQRLYQRAIFIRPRIKQMNTKVDTAQTNLELAQRNRYPDFNLAMTYGDRSGGRSDLVSVMVGVKIPLYAGSKQSKEVSQKSLELVESRHLSRNEEGLVMASIASAVADYQRSKKQFSLFGSGIVPQAQQTVASMLAAYQVNEIEFLDLVRSQIKLFNYELRYWKSLSDAKIALANIEAAVGEETIYE